MPRSILDSFVTVGADGPQKYLLWSAYGGKAKVIGVAAEPSPEHEGLPSWRFEEPTSMETGTVFNPGRHPVVDGLGAPLWPGCRVRFRLPAHYINIMSGVGALVGFDRYGGASLLADQEMPVRDRAGVEVARRREVSAIFNTYHADGLFVGCRQLCGLLGDPHEHGTVSTMVVVDDDPRSVCVRIEPTAAPGPVR